MRRTIGFAASAVFIATGLVTLSSSDAHGCSSAPAPFDPFAATVPTAGTIVIGTVESLSKNDPTAYFRLRIDEVVRGVAPAAMRFIGLRGGDQRSACGDHSTVITHGGDRLALAMSAAEPGKAYVVDAVAFVGQSQPMRGSMPKVEQLSRAKIRRLAGVPADGSGSRHPTSLSASADNLITERVGRGINRVSPVGTNHDLRAIRDLEIDLDGRVWAATRDRVFRMGQRKEFDGGNHLPKPIKDMALGSDGVAIVAGPRRLTRFHRYDHPQRVSSLSGPRERTSPMVGSDGTTFARSSLGVSHLTERDGSWDLVWTDYDWETVGAPAACIDADSSVDRSRCIVSGPAKVADGSVWLGFSGRGLGPPILTTFRRFEDGAWSGVPAPPDSDSLQVAQLVAYPGDKIWALQVPPNAPIPFGADAHKPPRLARWDGSAWEVHEIPAELWRDDAGGRIDTIVPGPDGVVWLAGPLARFDGERWARFDTPGHERARRPRIKDLAIAPDGTAWLVVRDDPATKKPGRGGVYVLDPTRAKTQAPALADNDLQS